MAHSLGLAAIAEGVEQRYQAANLLALGCDLAQGYWFGRPAEVSQLRQALAEQHRTDLAPRATPVVPVAPVAVSS